MDISIDIGTSFSSMCMRDRSGGISPVYIKTAVNMFGMEGKIIEALRSHDIDMIVLAGFMAILSKNFVSLYPERIINIHPSLIPSFCGEGFYGLHVHEAALNYGVKVTGATVHYVNEIPDGGKIICQKAVAIEDGDTP